MSTKRPKPVTDKTERNIITKGGDCLKNNSAQLVEKGKEVINEALSQEEEKIKKGFRWMSKNSSKKLVSPNRIELNLKEGWTIRELIKQECYKSGENCEYGCSGICKESC
jgi:hypothetical protein